MKNTNISESLKCALNGLAHEATMNAPTVELIRDITRFYWHHYFTVCHLKELSQAGQNDNLKDYISSLNLNKAGDDLFTLSQICDVMAEVGQVANIWVSLNR